MVPAVPLPAVWGLWVVCSAWWGLLSRLWACLQINRPPRAACLSPTSAAANRGVKATAVLTGAEHLDPVQLEVEKRGCLRHV